MKGPLAHADIALLAAYLLLAVLGTANSCLLFNDGAAFLSAAWLGNAWDLYLGQFAPRAVSLLASFGPAWLARALFSPSASTYLVVAHVLYFAAPLALWLLVHAVERQRLFARLYLAAALVQVNFPSELVVGSGLWFLWASIACDETRSNRQIVLATALLAPLMAFAHTVLALMSLVYLLAGTALTMLGRPLPRRSLVAAAILAALLAGTYLITSRLLPPTNPTLVVAMVLNRYDYIDPIRLLATVTLFPMLAVLWLLLLSPGADSVRAGGAAARLLQLPLAVVGLWFAAAGTGVLTWVYARHSAGHVAALALALAVAGPAAWLAASARPLTLFAAIVAVASVSYNIDLFLFGRFVDRYLEAHRPVSPVNVGQASAHWPPRMTGSYGQRGYLKWFAGDDYQRDVVVPVYDWYQVTLAFYSFFRSDRQAILYHPPVHNRDWIPLECGAAERALGTARDERDRRFLQFVTTSYCVR
jgi:hypothetical protein